MEALTLVFAILVSLVGFDFVAALWGTDSREPIGDDHIR
jgi:hypothetical protein